MASYILKQGDSLKVEQAILETPAIDFTTATSLVCILFVGETEQKRYSLATKTNYGVLEVDNISTNQINLFIEREESALFTVGVLSGYLIAEFPNLDFPSSVENKSYTFNIGRVMAGKGLDEIL